MGSQIVAFDQLTILLLITIICTEYLNQKNYMDRQSKQSKYTPHRFPKYFSETLTPGRTCGHFFFQKAHELLAIIQQRR